MGGMNTDNKVPSVRPDVQKKNENLGSTNEPCQQKPGMDLLTFY